MVKRMPGDTMGSSEVIYLVCGYDYDSCMHFYATPDRELAFKLREKWGDLLDDLHRWEEEHDRSHSEIDMQTDFYKSMLLFVKRCYPDIPVSPGVFLYYRGVCVEEVPLVGRSQK